MNIFLSIMLFLSIGLNIIQYNKYSAPAKAITAVFEMCLEAKYRCTTTKIFSCTDYFNRQDMAICKKSCSAEFWSKDSCESICNEKYK